MTNLDPHKLARQAADELGWPVVTSTGAGGKSAYIQTPFGDVRISDHATGQFRQYTENIGYLLDPDRPLKTADLVNDLKKRAKYSSEARRRVIEAEKKHNADVAKWKALEKRNKHARNEYMRKYEQQHGVQLSGQRNKELRAQVIARGIADNVFQRMPDIEAARPLPWSEVKAQALQSLALEAERANALKQANPANTVATQAHMAKDKTVAQLRDQAKAAGLKGYSKMRKAELQQRLGGNGPAGWSDESRVAAERARIEAGTKRIGDTVAPKQPQPATEPSKVDTFAAQKDAKSAAKAKAALEMKVRHNGGDMVSRAGAGGEAMEPLASRELRYKEWLKNGKPKTGKYALGLTIAGPLAVGLMAYDSTRSSAMAAGVDKKTANADAVKAGLAAGGTTAAVGITIASAIKYGMKASTTVAKVGSRALPWLMPAFMAAGAYQGYRKDGVKGAVVGALDVPTFGAMSWALEKSRTAKLTKSSPSLGSMPGSDAPQMQSGRGYLNQAAKSKAAASSPVRVTPSRSVSVPAAIGQAGATSYTTTDGRSVQGTKAQIAAWRKRQK